MSIWHSLDASVTCHVCGATQVAEFSLYHQSFYDAGVRDSVALGESLGQPAICLELCSLRRGWESGEVVRVLDWWMCRSCLEPDTMPRYKRWAILTLTHERGGDRAGRGGVRGRSSRASSPAFFTAAVAVPVTEGSLDLADAVTFHALEGFLDGVPANTPDLELAARVRSRLRSGELPPYWA